MIGFVFRLPGVRLAVAFVGLRVDVVGRLVRLFVVVVVVVGGGGDGGDGDVDCACFVGRVSFVFFDFFAATKFGS